MKAIYKVSTWILTALGILHIALTPVFYRGFTLAALWFAGTGLSILFLGLFNMAILRAAMQTACDLCLAANIIGFIYSVLLIILLPQPQAFLALLAFLGVTIGLIAMRKPILEESK